MTGEEDQEEQTYFWEDQTYFVGTCTCDHDQEQHSWGSCDVVMRVPGIARVREIECPCEAGWEE